MAATHKGLLQIYIVYIDCFTAILPMKIWSQLNTQVNKFINSRIDGE